jgi:hypothetical protein
MDAASDLDFTTVLSMPRGKPAPPASKTQPTHTAPVPPPPPPPSAAEKAQAEKSAKEQQDAFAQAREEAERKAAAARERVKAEAEAKMRAEQETKMRAEADAKLKAEAEAKARAEAEAKVRAAREAAEKAAAEAKAKAEAEAKRAREEAERARKEAEAIAARARKEAEEKAERARKEAEEKAERARKEAEEKARREQEELKRKLEEERKAREEAEQRAREEAKRVEEERRKLEEERKARAEEKRREEEERTQRRIQEQRERAARAREEAAEEEKASKRKEKPKEKEPEPVPELPKIAATSGGFSDTLLADLESFNTRDDQERKEREEAARKEKEAADARAKEAAERRAKEDAERQEREAKEARKREAAERKAREEAELRSREERERQRLQEEEERRKREAEERAKKAKEEEQMAARATRSGAFDAAERSKRERDLLARAPRGAARVERKGWGKPIAMTLFLLLVVALAAAHVMPIDTSDYERAATDAFGRPVKIGSANLWLVTGLQLRLSDVAIGEDIRLPAVRAFPELSALTGQRKEFSRIEIDRLKLAQDAVGNALFVKLKSDTFSVGHVVVKNVELTGPLVLPKGLELDVAYDWQGAVMAATVRGPEALVARLAPARKGSAIEVEMSAAAFALPFAPEISLSRFSMKGVATPQGMNVSEWDGALLNGTLSGTASVRWGDSWAVDGIVTARNINAAVFAPALLSDGKAEGSGKFSMRGQPGKLAAASRLDGSFTVTRGVLGSIDLSRAIQTGGRVATGQTQFNEMNGQATYDRGAVSLRNISIGAGQLSAGASADIAQNGALSGRIVADVKIAQQRLSTTLNLSGTVQDPQFRN